VSFGGTITSGKTYYQVRNSFLLAEKHSPSLSGFVRTGRLVIWALHQQACDSGGNISGWLGFVRWLLSAHPIARAARQGAHDYIFRRFGRRPTAKVAS
jgi:hypothetical protein